MPDGGKYYREKSGKRDVQRCGMGDRTRTNGKWVVRTGCSEKVLSEWRSGGGGHRCQLAFLGERTFQAAEQSKYKPLVSKKAFWTN